MSTAENALYISSDSEEEHRASDTIHSDGNNFSQTQNSVVLGDRDDGMKVDSDQEIDFSRAIESWIEAIHPILAQTLSLQDQLDNLISALNDGDPPYNAIRDTERSDLALVISWWIEAITISTNPEDTVTDLGTWVWTLSEEMDTWTVAQLDTNVAAVSNLLRLGLSPVVADIAQLWRNMYQQCYNSKTHSDA